MPLTTYTAGEVLTAASLNANFSFAASNPPGGFALISATTIGTAVSSVTVSSAFSATYDAYKIIITGGTGSVVDESLTLKLGSAATGYYQMNTGTNYNSVAALGGGSNLTRWTRSGAIIANCLSFNVDLINPFLSSRTYMTGVEIFAGTARLTAGYQTDTTSFTAFEIAPNSGTITGGTIRVYGYANS
jgi:hypothetical protein